MVQAPWWKGKRGEWLVVVQVALIALVFLGPRSVRGWPAFPSPSLIRAFGILLMAAGAVLFLAGLLRLGRNLTPLPYPKEDGVFVHTGAYRLVRHPMYSGGAFFAFGWALLVNGWLTLGYAAVLLVFLDIKSRREEQWLNARYADYRDYQRRVAKLVPFLY